MHELPGQLASYSAWPSSQAMLFQGRFHSFPLEGGYLLAAVRYVPRNPVRANLVDRPWDYQWSGAKWLVGEKPDDPLATSSDMLADITNPYDFPLQEAPSLSEFRRHTRTARPLGSESFLAHLEKLSGRILRPRKRGPKPRS